MIAKQIREAVKEVREILFDAKQWRIQSETIRRINDADRILERELLVLVERLEKEE